MDARVTEDDNNPHFDLRVSKSAPGEFGRAFVSPGGGHFFLSDADESFFPEGHQLEGEPVEGRQHVLAHEWLHMIGGPDEYAESSEAQAGETTDWQDCREHFQDIIDDEDATQEERERAEADLEALDQSFLDVRQDEEGFHAGIYALEGRRDVPDECFAIRGFWDPAHGPQTRLRPGSRSERGGTNISANANADDAARLSDRGNEVRPYMREGILHELREMLEGAFTPEVRFGQNVADMSGAELRELLRARLNALLVDAGVDGAAPRPGAREGRVEHDHDHEHDHGHGHGHGHDP